MACQARITKYLVAVVLFAGILAGCSLKHDSSQQIDAIINSFEAGNTQGAIASAGHLSYQDRGVAAFITYQFSLFDAIRNGAAPASLEKPAAALLDTKQDGTSTYQGATIAAKVFALYSAGREADAAQRLNSECLEWRQGDPSGCAKHMLGEALSHYYGIRDKFSAVYLFQASYILKRVMPGKALAGEFYQNLALVEIDFPKADHGFAAMIGRSQFNSVMAQQYCEFLSGTSYRSLIDCAKVPRSVGGGEMK